MKKNELWIKRKARAGWIVLSAGVLLLVIGLLMPLMIASPGFNMRIIGGLGILMIGIGVANLVRFYSASRDPQAARRVISAERDERLRAIRARAGSRAYVVSTVLVYALLMWLSLAASGSLPRLSDDALWFILAAIVLLPFGVYVYTIIEAQRNG